MADLEEWTPETHEWTPESSENDMPSQNNGKQSDIEDIQKEHPFLMKLAEALQKHPSLNKAIEKAAPYAEHFNRATQGTGLPNLAKGFFVGSDKLLRGLANATPTGVGLPDVNIPDPGWSQKEIAEVNPRIQKGAEITGEAIPYAAALMESLPALRHVGTALADIPLTRGAGARALNRVQEGLQERGMGNIRIPEEIFGDIENNEFLRNTSPNRRALERAREGAYEDLFNLQSDLGQRERAFTRDPFSAANRQFGRDIGGTRQDLLSHMRSQISEAGHEDLAELMRHGQNRYRQYMALRPYRNAALIGLVASSPLYKKLKKFIP